jgi:peptide/nickel transport system substrate-binding protein/oligopeptide transport system substrate-binding protein
MRTLRWALPLIGIVPLLVVACGQPSGGAALAADQTFVWPLQQENSVKDETFDPAQAYQYYDIGSIQMLFSGLVTLKQDLSVQPDLAKQVDISQDAKSYTFHLYPDLKFSDGQPIRSADFAYSINRSLDPSTGSPVAYYLCNLADAQGFNAGACSPTGVAPPGPAIKTLINDSILTPDSQTLVLKLAAPAAYFLDALTYSTSYPVEKSLVDKYPNGQWVYHLDEGGCSGPFKISSYTATNNGHPAVVYVPNPYWQNWHVPSRTVLLRQVIRPFVFDAASMYQEYRSGAYDYTDVPPEDYPYARGQADFEEVEGLKIQYFGVNFGVPPFDNLTVRQAFDLALNRQLMADRICQGGCIPTYHIVPQGMAGYNPDLINPPPDGTQSLTGNQSAAVNLLKQAAQKCNGATAFPVDDAYCAYIDAAHYPALKEIDLYVPCNRTVIAECESDTRVKYTRTAADQWNTVFTDLKINVQVQIILGSFGAYYGKITKYAYGIYALGWVADYPDPQDWLSLQFMANAQYNISHVPATITDSSGKSVNLTDLMTKADEDQDPAARMQEYNQAEQQVVDLVPWIPYEQEKWTWRQRVWVHGFALNGTGSFADTSWPDVFITQH